MAIADRITNDPDAPFTLASLVGDAGSGANGEKLVNTLVHAYPEALMSATLKRLNQRLTDRLDQDAIESVAKVAGASADSDLNVKVRGGDVREKDAVVTYAFHDEAGMLWKGCFPWAELGKSDPKGHVSQRESLAGSPEAEGFAEAQAKARAAADPKETAALRARVAELEAQQGTLGAQQSPADPAAALADASADDLTAMMAAHPERADAIKAFESATRGDRARKTVLEWEPPKSDGS